jgi:hypothetical protein
VIIAPNNQTLKSPTSPPLYKMSMIQNDSIVSINAHNQLKSGQELLKEERR